MKRRPTIKATFNAVPLRRVLVRLAERPAVETALEHVRLRIAPTVAKLNEWCSKPARKPSKRTKRPAPSGDAS